MNRGSGKQSGKAKPTAGARSGRRSPARRAIKSPPEPTPPVAFGETERARRFSALVRNACIKAGSAAAISTATTVVPVLGRLAPMLLGTMLETLTVARIQRQLVADVLELYEIELSAPEQRGIVLIATAANVGTQQLSKRAVENLVDSLRTRLGIPLIGRVLPLATLLAENAAAIASTYAVGRRAQAMCRLGRSDARDIGELLRGLTGIDRRMLERWSGEAMKLALLPFRAALSSLLSERR